jgi:predicted small secreted protein
LLENQPHFKTNPKMKKVLFLALALGSFTFTSCDSKKEEAQEQVGENVKDAGEAKADAMEDKADMVRDSADAKGEAIQDNADKMDAAGTTTTTTTEEVKK